MAHMAGSRKQQPIFTKKKTGDNDPIRVDSLRTYQEVNNFFNSYSAVCDDFMFILMLKQIYTIQSLSAYSDDFDASGIKPFHQRKENPT